MHPKNIIVLIKPSLDLYLISIQAKSIMTKRSIVLKALGMLMFLALITGCKREEDSNNVDYSKNPRPNIVFLIADDWSYPHAGAYGDNVVRTPTFDWLANEGALFKNAFCAAPSCSPSRASILTSRYPHQLESAGNLWSIFPKKFSNWVSILEESGYHTGKSRKGWGPGDFRKGGYEHNPAGKDYSDFDGFLKERESGQPFFYWFGSNDPHRIYETNTGAKAGMDQDAVIVPGFLPELACVRNDILDYYFEVERFDRESGRILKTLEEQGMLDNTIVIMTSDNGMPFPRAKATLYDYGTRMPLAIYWKGQIEKLQSVEEFVNFIDFGPTILEVAGLEIPSDFSGNSLMELFKANSTITDRDKVFLERERHANARKGDLGYPARAIRSKDFLYIKNFEPDRWPAGDPNAHRSVGQYGDVDNSISKFLIMAMKENPIDIDYFQLAFDKRPSEELYILADDPYNLKNEIQNPKYRKKLDELRNELQNWMVRTNDLRAIEPQTNYWDEVEYTIDYNNENFNVQEKIGEYIMLVRNGGGFKEVGCE